MDVIPVCAAVILRSGAVLLCRRGAGRKHAGKWEFPGGRIEPGETPQAALKRELKEELGIDSDIQEELARTQHAYDFGTIELRAFKVTKFSGELKPTDHDQLAWVEARRLLAYDLAPADIPIAQVVASHRRRDRYRGTHPRAFADKYKELQGDAEAMAKAKARGATPAGTHRPIMLEEVLAALSPLPGATILDCTLGWGGHCEALARAGASVIALDRDAEELSRTLSRLQSAGISIAGRHANYSEARAALKELGVAAVNGVLADLGVSSMQLDRPERGLSFKLDGPLDMRMDRSRGPTAADWLRDCDAKTVAEALTRYAEEPDAEKIARAIAGRKIATTRALAGAVAAAKGLPPESLKKKDAFSFHPAARTFQALRIVVNQERDALTALLRDLPGMLKPGGRAVFLTFHSGEEKLVEAAVWRPGWKAEPPSRPSPAEVHDNPRARSARLYRAVRT